MTDDEILAIAEKVYKKFSSDPKPGYVRAARIEFAREIEIRTLRRICAEAIRALKFDEVSAEPIGYFYWNEYGGYQQVAKEFEGTDPAQVPLYDHAKPCPRCASLQAKIDRLDETISEQLGTIKALNIALGGFASTSTENLIDASEVDFREDGQGLISLVRDLTAENVRLVDKLETSGFSPFTEETEDILRARVKALESAIEHMRVAGGSAEFQKAFDLAKGLLK